MTFDAEPRRSAPPHSGAAHGGGSEPPEYLVDRLQRAIATEPGLHEQGVVVHISRNRVLLSGWVPAAAAHDAVGRLVRQLAPDLQVVNEIEIHPTRPPDEVEHL